MCPLKAQTSLPTQRLFNYLKHVQADQIPCFTHTSRRFFLSMCTLFFRCPEDVICCILHSNSNRVDVSTRIQHILIEAYCLENEIEVIKVDSQDEIASLLKMTPLDEKELDCILICKKEVATDSETDSSFQDSDDEYDWPS